MRDFALYIVRRQRSRAATAAGWAVALLLAACATRAPAPVVERSPPPPRAPVTASASAPVPQDKAQEPDWRPQTYTVKRGDTLHAIALDHGLDYRELASWNGLDNPNLILVGQVLRLTAPGDAGPLAAPAAGGAVTMPLRTVPPVPPGDARPVPSPSAQPLAMPGPRSADTYKSSPKAVKEPYSEQAVRELQRAAVSPPPGAAPTAAAPPPAPAVAASTPASASAPAQPAASTASAVPAGASAAVGAGAAGEPRTASTDSTVGKPAGAAAAEADTLSWVWPATGKVVTGFSDTANLKGIDIAGKSGQPVVASAAGKVVYAGSGLRGYGKLVIVKHNATFLSAYAHNQEILVKEGQQVARGQKIAEMGSTDSDQVKLHFEIRQRGKPVDPLRYLPPG